MLRFRSKYLEASLMPSTRSLISDKARRFSQSERALYGNFIIIINNVTRSRKKQTDDNFYEKDDTFKFTIHFSVAQRPSSVEIKVKLN